MNNLGLNNLSLNNLGMNNIGLNNLDLNNLDLNNLGLNNLGMNNLDLNNLGLNNLGLNNLILNNLSLIAWKWLSDDSLFLSTLLSPQGFQIYTQGWGVEVGVCVSRMVIAVGVKGCSWTKIGGKVTEKKSEKIYFIFMYTSFDIFMYTSFDIKIISLGNQLDALKQKFFSEDPAYSTTN